MTPLKQHIAGLLIVLAVLAIKTGDVQQVTNSLRPAEWKAEGKTGLINEVLHQLWHDIGDRIQSRMAKPLEEGLRQKLAERNYRDFTFERIKIGTVPLKIEQFRVFKNVTQDAVTDVVDLFVKYEGDCTIWFSLYYASLFIPLPTTRAAMENLRLSGVLRVAIHRAKDLNSWVGGIEAYFPDNPRLDFDVAGVNILMAGYVQPAKAIVRDYVVSRIAAHLVYPNKMVLL